MKEQLKAQSIKYENAIARAGAVYDTIGTDLGPDRFNAGRLEVPEDFEIIGAEELRSQIKERTEIVKSNFRTRTFPILRRHKEAIDSLTETEKGDEQGQGQNQEPSVLPQREGIKQKTKTTISNSKLEESTSSLTTSSVAQKIIDMIPEQFLEGVLGKSPDLENYVKQVENFARYTVDIYGGKVPLVTPLEVVGIRDSEKVKLTAEIIRQNLAMRVSIDSPRALTGFQHKWNRGMKELVDLLGKNAQEQLRMVIENLPDPERALFFSISSMKLTRDLEFIDADECSSERLANYLRDATFAPEQKKDESFEKLITTLHERIFEGTISPEAVIEVLCDSEYAGLIFERMVESATKNNFRDLLITLFSSHPATYRFAVKLENEIRGVS